MASMIEKNVPKLRFKEFSEEWELTNLGSVGEVRMCKRVFSEQTLSKGEIPFYKIGSFGKKADAFISRELYENFKIKYSFPKKGDILISAAGTIGRTVVYNGEDAYFQDSNIVWLEINDKKIINNFLNYIYSRVVFTTEGGTIQRLYNNILRGTKIQIPSLPEQVKIANYLTALDEKISLLSEKESELIRYKKAMMQKMFSQEIRFKDDNGKDFADWEEKKLGDVTYKASSSLSANQIIDNVGGYKLYGAVGLIKMVNFFQEDKPYISIVKDGAGVGRVLLCDAYSSVLGTLDKIHVKHNFDLKFIYMVLLNFDFTKYTTGSTIPHIYFKDYSKYSLPLPSLPEQQKIANFLSAIDDSIEKVKKLATAMQSFKKAMLQQMFV